MADARWEIAQVGLPADITAPLSVVEGVVDVLVGLLNSALSILDIIQALIPDYIDPFQAVLQSIIELLRGLINDLRGIGVYATFDDPVYPFTNLTGGFNSFSSRMYGKLTNRLDETRPSFSPAASVVGAFFYVSADPAVLYKANDFGQSALDTFGNLRRFFSTVKSKNDPKQAEFPEVTGLKVSYGYEGIRSYRNALEVLRGNNEPTIASVKWTLAFPPTISGPLTTMAVPAKFLVEVSTLPEGLGLAYAVPKSSAGVDADGQQNQNFGIVVQDDGSPFRLYGGLDILQMESTLLDAPTGNNYPIPGIDPTTATVKTNDVVVYGYQNTADNQPIPPSAFPLFQRTFVYDVSALVGLTGVSPGQTFSIRLPLNQMPPGATVSDGPNGTITIVPNAEPSRELYVRIRPATDGFDYDSGTQRLTATPAWYLFESDVQANKDGLVTLSASPNRRVGKPSNRNSIQFPSIGVNSYLDTITVALVLLVLSRSDLKPLVDPSNTAAIQYIKGMGGFEPVALVDGDPNAQSALGQELSSAIRRGGIDIGLLPTGLEPVAKSLLPDLADDRNDPNFGSYFAREGDNAAVFRRRLLAKCRNFAARLLDDMGTPSNADITMLEQMSEVTLPSGEKVPLRKLTWAQLVGVGLPITVLDSMSDPKYGPLPNPVSVPGRSPMRLRRMFYGDHPYYELKRSPGFLINLAGATTSYNFGQGSADMSPVITNAGELASVLFVRNVLFDAGNVYDAIGRVLGVAVSTYLVPESGAWHSYRFFPQGLPFADAALQQALDFTRAVYSGTQGTAQALNQYIQLVEARILDLEGVLRQIQSLLDLSAALSFGPIAVLPVVASGTDELAQQFITASNTPTDAATAIGFGGAVVAGGAPQVLLDVLLSLFTVEE
jgi:hypothetical protein